MQVLNVAEGAPAQVKVGILAKQAILPRKKLERRVATKGGSQNKSLGRNIFHQKSLFEAIASVTLISLILSDNNIRLLIITLSKMSRRNEESTPSGADFPPLFPILRLSCYVLHFVSFSKID